MRGGDSVHRVLEMACREDLLAAIALAGKALHLTLHRMTHPSTPLAHAAGAGVGRRDAFPPTSPDDVTLPKWGHVPPSHPLC